MSRYHPGNIGAVLAAAEHWRDNALFNARAVLSDEPIWTTSNIEELARRFIDNPDETDRTFIDKLHDQLSSSAKEIKQLAAEVTWLLLLSPSNVSPDRKRENV